MHRFTQAVIDEMARQGLPAVLVGDLYDAEAFGHAEALFDWNGLRLNFIHDRASVVLVELAAGGDPRAGFGLSDIEQAMGWRSDTPTFERLSEAGLGEVARAVASLKEHGEEIRRAFREDTSIFEAQVRSRMAKAGILPPS